MGDINNGVINGQYVHDIIVQEFHNDNGETNESNEYLGECLFNMITFGYNFPGYYLENRSKVLNYLATYDMSLDELYYDYFDVAIVFLKFKDFYVFRKLYDMYDLRSNRLVNDYIDTLLEYENKTGHLVIHKMIDITDDNHKLYKRTINKLIDRKKKIFYRIQNTDKFISESYNKDISSIILGYLYEKDFDTQFYSY